MVYDLESKLEHTQSQQTFGFNAIAFYPESRSIDIETGGLKGLGLTIKH